MAVKAQGVLVGVWLLVTFHFQPSPLASKLRAALRKEEQSVNLSLPVNSLSTASPVQCLLVAAGVTGCREAPTLNLQGRLLYNPTVEQVRRKLPMAMKTDEVVQDLCDPTADQAEEEKTPNSCDSGWGCTRLPMAVKAEEDIHKYIWPNSGIHEEEKAPNGSEGGWGHITYPLWEGKLWTNLDGTDSSALAGNWLRRDNSDQKHQSFEVRRYKPSWQGAIGVPTHLWNDCRRIAEESK